MEWVEEFADPQVGLQKARATMGGGGDRGKHSQQEGAMNRAFGRRGLEKANDWRDFAL